MGWCGRGERVQDNASSPKGIVSRRVACTANLDGAFGSPVPALHLGKEHKQRHIVAVLLSNNEHIHVYTETQTQ